MIRKIWILGMIFLIIFTSRDSAGRGVLSDATDCNDHGENHDADRLCKLDHNESIELIIYNDDEFIDISANLVEFVEIHNNGSCEIGHLFGENDSTGRISPGDMGKMQYSNMDFNEKNISIEIITYYNNSLSGDQQKQVEISYSFLVFDQFGNIIQEEKRFPDEDEKDHPSRMICCLTSLLLTAGILIILIIISRIFFSRKHS